LLTAYEDGELVEGASWFVGALDGCNKGIARSPPVKRVGFYSPDVGKEVVNSELFVPFGQVVKPLFNGVNLSAV